MSVSKIKWAKIIVTILAIVTIIVMGCVISELRYKLKVSEHNYETSKSELTSEKIKNNNMLYEKDAYILNEREMMEELEISKKENKELSKRISSQAVYISKLESSINVDTIFVKNDSIIYIDNTPSCIKFSYNDDWLSLKGKTDLTNNITNIYGIDMPVPITVGLTKNYSIFVETSNPYLTITDIKAVALEEFVKKASKKKHWAIGAYGGFGMHYGLVHRQFDFGPQLGVGIIYRF